MYEIKLNDTHWIKANIPKINNNTKILLKHGNDIDV